MQNKPWAAPPRYIFRKYNVLNEIGKLRGIQSFLDVGCGAGDMVCSIAEKYSYKGTGIDFSEEAIKNANSLKKHRKINNVSFKLIDAFSSNSFPRADLITCFEVLEHVKDDDKLLKQVVASSSKYVVVSVPAKKRLFSESDVAAGHYRRYEKTELKKLLEKNNLTILKFTSYGYPFTNIIRLGREAVAKRKKSSKATSLEDRSKKSGVDLLEVNKYFGSHLESALMPFYRLSTLFNSLDLAEGYLVVCEKNKK